MATTYSEDEGVTLSVDEARGGVTGHHVHHVLIAGLTGVIAAFLAIALIFNFDRVYAALANLFTQDPVQLILLALPYALIAAAGAVVGYLLLKVWTALSGASGNESETLMRLRVVTQFAVICVVLASYYWAMR